MLNCHKVYRFNGIKHASVVANAVLRVSMPANTQMISGFHKGKTSTRIVKDDARGDQNQNAYFFWPKLCHYQGAFGAVKSEYIRRRVREILAYWRTIVLFGVLAYSDFLLGSANQHHTAELLYYSWRNGVQSLQD